jgi:hypothetical protein
MNTSSDYRLVGLNDFLQQQRQVVALPMDVSGAARVDVLGVRSEASAEGSRERKHLETRTDEQRGALVSSEKRAEATSQPEITVNAATWRDAFLRCIYRIKYFQQQFPGQVHPGIKLPSLVDDLSKLYGINEENRGNEKVIIQMLLNTKVGILRDLAPISEEEWGEFPNLSSANGLQEYLTELNQVTEGCGKEKFNFLMRELKTRLLVCEKIEGVETIIGYLTPNLYNLFKPLQACITELLAQCKIGQCINSLQRVLPERNSLIADPAIIDQALGSFKYVYEELVGGLVIFMGGEEARKKIAGELAAAEQREQAMRISAAMKQSLGAASFS